MTKATKVHQSMWNFNHILRGNLISLYSAAEITTIKYVLLL